MSDPERVASLVLLAVGGELLQQRRELSLDLDDLVGLVQLFGQALVLLAATWASAGHDDAARSQITTVIVRGDREHAMVADCSDAIAERIPGSHCVLIPGADHMLPLRVPGRLAEIIADQAG